MTSIFRFLSILISEENAPAIFKHDGKKFEVYPMMHHLCAKKKKMVIYEELDNQLDSNACAIKYHKYECLNYDELKPFEKKDLLDMIAMNSYHCSNRKLIQNWKMIFTSVKSRKDCYEKALRFQEKLEKKRFSCIKSAIN